MPLINFTLNLSFMSLSLGGSISYVETSDMTQNIPAILEIIKYIYDNMHVCGIKYQE